MEDVSPSLSFSSWRKTPRMPTHSRAFDFQKYHDLGDAQRPEDNFFVPSYLVGSAYARKLEEAYRAKASSYRDAKLRAAESGISGGKSVASAKAALPPGSHRGLSHAVVERGTDGDGDESQSLPSLPTRWNKEDIWGGIEVQPDGLSLKYTGPRNFHEREHEASAVRADHFMPPQCGIYYFEVDIMHGKKDDTTIAIGFITKSVPLSRPIGWEAESWGFHGDDGRVFTGHNNGRTFSQGFNPGDVIGCGINFQDHTAFYTKNGVHLGTAFDRIIPEEKLYPSISLKKPGEYVRVNFGQSPFTYNIDDMMKEQKERVQNDISKVDISKLADLKENELIQALILQSLQHDGYVETARAFAEDMRIQKNALNKTQDADVEQANFQDDEDAGHRQRIRRAILDGDIQHALQITNTHYPKVLRDNENVYFKLRCRHFIELVRRTAELNASVSAAKEKRQRWGGLEGNDGGLNLDPAVSDSQYEQQQQQQLVQLEQSMLQYGQELQDQYSGDPAKQVQTALKDIWGLLAYRNPLKEPEVSHILDKKGRLPVSEELNSAILLSLGKSSRAALEKIYAQTSVLLEDLQNEGGDGAFVSVKDLVDTIPEASEEY